MKYIYGIKDKRNDKIIYIGKTKNFEQRKANHLSDKRNTIDMYMLKEGRDNFEMIVLEEFEDNISNEELNYKEEDYIQKYNTLLNGFNKQHSGNITKDEQYHKNYFKSEKGKAVLKKYLKSEKGKVTRRAADKRFKDKKKQQNFIINIYNNNTYNLTYGDLFTN